MLSERPAQTEPEQDMQVRFSMAPEPADPLEEGPDSADTAPSDLPPLPEAGELPTETAALTPDVPVSLDQPSPPTPPLPSGQPEVLPTTPQEAQPVSPTENLKEADADAEEPPSDGLPDGVEQQPNSELEFDTGEPFDEPDPKVDPAADALSTSETDVDTDLVLPETDDGELLGALRSKAPFPQSPPAPGRLDGPSLDERISDFSRALQEQRTTSFQQPSEAPRNAFEPDWSSLPTTGQALGNMLFESGDYDWTEYQRQIYWIIWRSWHSRLLARADDFEKWAQQSNTWYMDHFNVVQFTIERNGEISSIAVETESGMLPLDLSAVEGLDEAVLPPLPDDFQGDNETVHAQFIGQGQISFMRRGLQRYRDAGVF